MLKLIAISVSLLAALTGTAQAEVSNAHYYSNQTPYGNLATAPTVAPPLGYSLMFLENVGRHGSRSMTSDNAEVRALAVWSAASRSGGLTTAGKLFDDDVRAFQAAELTIGYGNLSAIGKAEWQGIGRRTGASYYNFLNRAAAAGGTVEFRSSPVYRTQQSATAMKAGLSAAVPALTFTPRITDYSLLIANGASSAGNAAIDSIEHRLSVRTAARHVLRQLYTSSYIDSLSNRVAKALDIYLLYCISPGMRSETNVTFARYIPIEDAPVMAYAKDAQNFYRYGPGVAGETSSYRQVKPVLVDFFARLDARVAGGKTAAVFRLGHGETTMPFAALIKAPGSEKQAPKSAPYSYGTNPWRGYVAGRPGGNIEWAAYRNVLGIVLVTMRYNEVPVKFRSACTPAGVGSYFYRLSELKSCLL